MNRIATLLAVGAVALVAGCKDPEMEKRVAALETKIEELEKAPKGPAAAKPVDNENERAAGELLREAMKLGEAGDAEAAKAKIAEIKAKYADTRAGRQAPRVEAEIAIIGSPAGEIDAVKWFQGNANLADGKATLVVFWEVWCPHCQREVPKLEATYAKYHGQGLNMVAATKVTKSATDEGVEAFIKEKGISYPVVKEGGQLSERYAIRGIPAAAAIKDGKVVWRGHPATITDQMIEGWLSAS